MLRVAKLFQVRVKYDRTPVRSTRFGVPKGKKHEVISTVKDSASRIMHEIRRNHEVKLKILGYELFERRKKFQNFSKNWQKKIGS